MKKITHLNNTFAIFCLTFLGLGTFSLKAQSSKYRLIQFESEIFDNQSQAFEKIESLRLTYSQGRGSDIKNQVLDYDTAYVYDTLSQGPIRRVINVFDNNSNITSTTTEKYNDYAAKWEKQTKQTHTYDNNNNLLSSTQQQWSVSFSMWKNTNRTLYAYNSGGIKASETTQNWIDSTTTWENLRKISFNYGSINLISRVQSNWRNSNWENSFKTTYTYDFAGRLEKEVQKSFRYSKWMKFDSLVYVYSSSSSNWLSESVFFRWDDLQSSYYKSSKTIYTHNPGDYDYSSEISQRRDTAQNKWNNNKKTVNTFKPFKKYDQQTRYKWSSGMWEKKTRSSYSYENFGTTAIKENVKDQIETTVYPNPAINIVNFQFKNPLKGESVQLRVFNNNGQLVSQQSFNNTHTAKTKIHWNPLVHDAKSGIYYYQITSGEYQAQGQFIVK